MVIVLSNLRSLKLEKSANENYHQDAIKLNIWPKFPQQTTFGTLVKEIAKTSSYGDPLHENCRNVFFQKHASTLTIAMVTKGGRRRLKNIFCFGK